MSNNPILIIDSHDRDRFLETLANELVNSGKSIETWSLSDRRQFRLLSLLKVSGSARPVLCFLLPLLKAVYAYMLWSRLRESPDRRIILHGILAQCIFTPIFRDSKHAFYWMDFNEPLRGWRGKIARFISNAATIIVPSNHHRSLWIEAGWNAGRIEVLPPAWKTNQPRHQENIFHSLAHKEYGDSRRKFFTIGVISELIESQKIENIFMAAQMSRMSIPNLQIVVVGDGPEKKNLVWLAKKMEIDRLVWFVGEQANLKKWLENMDVYVAAGQCLGMDERLNILAAMSAGIPVIGPASNGLDELISENKSGALVEFGNTEMLSRQLIHLSDDQVLRRQLGINGKERFDKYFTVDRMILRLLEIIN